MKANELHIGQILYNTEKFYHSTIGTSLCLHILLKKSKKYLTFFEMWDGDFGNLTNKKSVIYNWNKEVKVDIWDIDDNTNINYGYQLIKQAKSQHLRKMIMHIFDHGIMSIDEYHKY